MDSGESGRPSAPSVGLPEGKKSPVLSANARFRISRPNRRRTIVLKTNSMVWVQRIPFCARGSKIKCGVKTAFEVNSGQPEGRNAAGWSIRTVSKRLLGPLPPSRQEGTSQGPCLSGKGCSENMRSSVWVVLQPGTALLVRTAAPRGRELSTAEAGVKREEKWTKASCGPVAESSPWRARRGGG